MIDIRPLVRECHSVDPLALAWWAGSLDVVMTIKEISVDELAELLDAGARLVDVREPHEFDQARVPGGVLVPLGSVPDALDHFPPDDTTYVICRSGARSLRACEFVAQHGRDAVNVAGGILAWIESGRPVDSGT